MANAFVPELGQGLFGGRVEEWKVPEYVTALLRYVGDEIARVESNRLQDVVEPPIGWTGPYSTPVFIMRGYRYPGDDGMCHRRTSRRTSRAWVTSSCVVTSILGAACRRAGR